MRPQSPSRLLPYDCVWYEFLKHVENRVQSLFVKGYIFGRKRYRMQLHCIKVKWGEEKSVH